MSTAQMPRVPGSARVSAPASAAVHDFRELLAQVRSAGLLERRYAYYWSKLIGMVFVYAVLVGAVIILGDSWWQLLLAPVAAIVMTQTAFLGHDAAHKQIFRSGRWNDWVSLLVANLFVGLSYGWWRHKHTKHHANPNKVGADPDIEMEVLAFTSEQAAGRRSPLTRWLSQRQGWFFFPLLLLEGLNLHYQGVRRVLGREPVERRGVELTFLTARLGGYIALLLLTMSPVKALTFMLLHLGLFGLYMGASFAPNHKGMPLVPKDAKIDFLRRQVLMSRNVRGGRFIDVALGGLNYQIEHHLFPSMPRLSLRKAQPLVVKFCAEKQVPYVQTGLFESYGIVVRHLNAVGLGERDPFTCPLVQAYR